MTDISEELERLSAAFDKLCQERHEEGAKEYGTFTFMGNDVIRMMMEELADTANYCRMQFIKLMFLQHEIERRLNNEQPEFDIGKDAFKGAGEVGWDK